MNLFNYRRRPDGNYFRRVEFDVPGKPGIIQVIHIIRDAKGRLIRGETQGRFRAAIKPVDNVKQD